MVALYAVKHVPFLYFRSVQEGNDPRNSMNNVVSFEGPRGLFADLRSGRVPAFAFIAPNQCNEQHGRGNGGAFCNYDPASDGTQAGTNPALIYRGDVTLRKLVTSIKNSPVWRDGRNAIVVVWDENDFSTAPSTNQVMLIVDTNLRRSRRAEREALHPFLAAQVARGRLRPALPQPRLRQGRRRYVRPVRRPRMVTRSQNN